MLMQFNRVLTIVETAVCEDKKVRVYALIVSINSSAIVSHAVLFTIHKYRLSLSDVCGERYTYVALNVAL